MWERGVDATSQQWVLEHKSKKKNVMMSMLAMVLLQELPSQAKLDSTQVVQSGVRVPHTGVHLADGAE
eukprot:8211546-Ditylum_brightwellii.AAC.1